MRKLKAEMLPRLLSQSQPSGVRLGRVVAVEADGRVLVDYAGNPFGPVAARLTLSVKPAAVRSVFERGGEVLLALGGPGADGPVLFDVVGVRPPRRARAAMRTPEQSPAPTEPEVGTARLGRIVAVQDGAVVVDYDGNGAGPRPAQHGALRNLKDAVLLQFLPGGEPVIVGQLFAEVPVEEAGGVDVVLKGRRVRIEAEAELELVAGDSRIHLDARGKAVTTADQVVSRARGANKVQGGCVQLN